VWFIGSWVTMNLPLHKRQTKKVQIVIEAREMRIQVLNHFLLGLGVLLFVQI
jgi:hypothetical protein